MFQNASVKTKMVVILVLISAVPLLISIGVNFYSTMEKSIEQLELVSQQRVNVIDSNITGLFEQNRNGIRSLAVNAETIRYLQEPTVGAEEMDGSLVRTNEIFKDSNPTLITDTNGQQLMRSDHKEPVNTSTRAYFKDAMAGKESISDVVISKATGRFISVIAVPVLNAQKQPIGMVQRDYDLGVLADFVKSAADDHTSVLIIDRQGKLLSHSGRKVEKEEDRTDENEFAFVKDALSGKSGTTEVELLDGNQYYVSYAQNPTTGWVIATATPRPPPPPPRAAAGAAGRRAAWHVMRTALTMTSSASSSRSTEPPTKSWPRPKPALLTSSPMGRVWLRRRVQTASTPSVVDRSAASASVRTPATCRILSAVSSSRAASRATRTRSLRSAARCQAISRPMPELAPVMSALPMLQA